MQHWNNHLKNYFIFIISTFVQSWPTLPQRKVSYCFTNLSLKKKKKIQNHQKYHILFYCILVHKTFMLHSLSNKLFCFISCFFNKTEQFQRGKSALQGFNISINTRTLRSCWILFFTQWPWHGNTDAHTHTHTHSVSYCPYCTNTLTLSFPNMEAEQATLELIN